MPRARSLLVLVGLLAAPAAAAVHAVPGGGPGSALAPAVSEALAVPEAGWARPSTAGLPWAVAAWEARLGVASDPARLAVLEGLDPALAGAVAALLGALLEAAEARDAAYAGVPEGLLLRLVAQEQPAVAVAVDTPALRRAASRLAAAVDAAMPALEASRAGLRSPPAAELVPPAVDLAPVLVLDPAGVANVYDRDAVLAVDLGGDDLYDMNAGGSVLGLYFGGTPPGCQLEVGPVGVGCENEFSITVLTAALLIDLDGNDRYGVAKPPRAADAFCTSEPVVRRIAVQGAGSAGVGMLVDARGNDRYHARTIAQGHGHVGGVGVLADLTGDDHYSAIRAAMGSGLVGGAGLLLEGSGHDSYTFAAPKGGVFNIDLGICDATERMGLGAGSVGALGVMVEQDGDDRYRVDDQALGYAGLGSGGAFLDLGGVDDYGGYPGRADGAMAVGAGVFVDQAGQGAAQG